MSALTLPEHHPRIDHQGYAPEIWVGLLLTALYLMQAGPVLSSLSSTMEFVVELVMAIGCTLSLIGASLGTRWFFPKVTKRRAYRLHLVGLPLIVAALAWYTYAAAYIPSLLVVTLGGALGLCIEIASVRMFVEIAQELSEDEP